MHSNLFYRALEKIKQEKLFVKDDKIILACSGGPDSVALLDILARSKSVFNLKITVAYFNHGLRPVESEREKEYVQRLSSAYGLRFKSGEGGVRAFASKNKISLQEAGRYLRYNFLFGLGERLNIRKIVLGHHQDDTVETVLLSFLKGTGLKGLSGIETVRTRDNFLLIRPLLDFSKREIASYLSQRKIRPCLDSSNLKKNYLRNRLRLKIIPVLRRDINSKVDNAILRLSEIYSKENEYLDKVVSKNIKKVIGEKGGRLYIERKKFLKYHPAIERRFLRELFGRLGIIGEGGNFRQIEILKNFILTFHPGQKLDLPGGFTARGGYGEIYIEKKTVGLAPAVKQQARAVRRRVVKMNVPGETRIPDLDLKIQAEFTKKPPSFRDMKKASPYKVFLDAQKIKLPLYLRTRRPGDSFKPLGMKGTVKLKKYFINIKVQQENRGLIPIIVSGKDIIWVGGFAVSEPAKVTPYTKDVLVLSIDKRRLYLN